MVVQSYLPSGHQPELSLTAFDADDNVLVNKTTIPFRDLAKHLNVGPEDLVTGEWARIYGDDWRYTWRSPKGLVKQLDLLRVKSEGDEVEYARSAIVFAINLIESIGYLRVAQTLRTIVKLGLGIETKHWYHYQ